MDEKESIRILFSVLCCEGLINKSTSHVAVETDPFAIVYDENGKKVLQTSVVFNTLNPTWSSNSTAQVCLHSEGTLQVQIWHKASEADRKMKKTPIEDQFLGECIVRGAHLFANKKGQDSCPLKARVKEPDPMIKARSLGERLGCVTFAWEVVQEENALNDSSSRPLLGKLRVVSCHGVLKRNIGAGDLSDPYYKYIGPHGNAIPFPAVNCTLNPIFEEKWIAVRNFDVDPIVELQIWNANPKPRVDDILGSVVLDLRTLPRGISSHQLCPRKNEQDLFVIKMAGRLGTVDVCWEPEVEGMCAPPKEACEKKSQLLLSPSKLLEKATVNALGCCCPVRTTRKTSPPAPAPKRKQEIVDVTIPSTVPVLVVAPNGQSFTYEIEPDAALEPLMDAISNNFKVCPISQVLTYNGNLINTALSLRENNALLLKGEPYVKLHMSVAKGPILSIVCLLPKRNTELPVSILETATVADLKRYICSHEGVKLNPEEIHVIYQNNRLNDESTLLYYSIPNRSRLKIERRITPQALPPPNITRTLPPKNVIDKLAPTSTSKKSRQQQAPKVQHPLSQSSSTAKAGPSILAHAKKVEKNNNFFDPLQPAPHSSSFGLLAASRQHKNYMESFEGIETMSPEDIELMRCRRNIEDLRSKIEEIRQQPDDAPDYPRQHADVGQLEHQLSNSKKDLDAALARIRELEETVSRYQELIRRCLDAGFRPY